MSHKNLLKKVADFTRVSGLTSKDSKMFEKELKTLLTKAKQKITKPNTVLIKKAFIFAEQKHINQRRSSGEPYFSHLYAVADILLDYNVDSETIAAGLLHDVLEDTDVTEKELTNLFGKNVTLKVKGVKKLDSISKEKRKEFEIKSLQKLLMASTKDFRVILIKLADKLHNMRTISFVINEKKQRIAQHALDVYAPIASRMGMNSFEKELQDLCFEALDSKKFEQIKKDVIKKKSQTKKIAKLVKTQIKSKLSPFKRYEFDFFEKSIFHIYNKMIEKNKTASEIYDCLVLVVNTNTVSECYETLGLIHSSFYPVPGKLKDYIAVPRDSTYKSIHTTIIGPNGYPLRVYIRTKEMNEIAKKGISVYSYDKRTADDYSKKIKSNFDLFNKSNISSSDFFGQLKKDFLKGNIFVFNQLGKMISIPKGSTVLDFVYLEYDSKANFLKKTEINDKEYCFYYELKVGERIKLTFSDKKTVSKDWIHMTNSEKTREKICKALGLKTNKVITGLKGPTWMYIECIDKIGLLKNISAILTKNKLNIERALQEKVEDHVYLYFLFVGVSDKKIKKTIKELSENIKEICIIKEIDYN